jgi:hypothetical protein
MPELDARLVDTLKSWTLRSDDRKSLIHWEMAVDTELPRVSGLFCNAVSNLAILAWWAVGCCPVGDALGRPQR